MNPASEAVAVKPAHVPVVYQVPALMMQPVALPPVVTWSVPLPAKGVPGGEVGVGAVVVVVRVVGGGGLEVLGRYFMPVAGQEPFDPSGEGVLVLVWWFAEGDMGRV